MSNNINLLLESIRNCFINNCDIDIENLELPFKYDKKYTQVYITLFQEGKKPIRWGSRRDTLSNTIKRVINKLKLNQNIKNFNLKTCFILFEIVTKESPCDIRNLTTMKMNSPNKFEPGISGLKYIYKGETRFFMPTDGYTKSIINTEQLLNNIYIKCGGPKEIVKSRERLEYMKKSNITCNFIKSFAVISLSSTEYKQLNPFLIEFNKNIVDKEYNKINMLSKILCDINNLVKFGKTLRKERRFKESIEYFKYALLVKPNDLNTLSLLASSFRRLRKFNKAIEIYTEVLSIDSKHWESLVGLSIAYRLTGKLNLSKDYANKAVHSKPFSIRYHAGENAPIVLVIKTLGNLHFRERISGYAIAGGHNTADALIGKQFTRINMYVDIFNKSSSLLKNIPKASLVFNIMSDADAISIEYWELANELVEYLDIPVINRPKSVQATTRNGIYNNIHNINGIIMPKTTRININEKSELESYILNSDIKFPIIVRPTGSQTGAGMVLYKDKNDLVNRTKHLDSGEYYIAEFYNFQSEDNYWRKARIFSIGGKILPEHYVAADHWNIHAKNARKLMNKEEFINDEINFIKDFKKILGKKRLDAIKKIQNKLNLDYFGIDCALLPDGNLLVFEINPGMQFKSASQAERPFLLKNRAKISKSFDEMINKKIQKPNNKTNN